jgi:ribosomal protein L11 methyltransferase
MDYYELRFRLTAMDEASDMLVAMLGDIGFESFIEEDDLLKAYISAIDFNDECKVSLTGSEISRFYASYESELIKDRNWNAVWESEYDPVIIDNKLIIRAPFHTKPADIPLDIIIEPKMSFGTAHHETTRLMLRYLLQLDLANKSLLDMGCGTAALAILARKLGANPVTAIDKDEWAYNNSRENIGNNNIDDISVYLGDAGLLPGMSFDVVLANINRNILLRDIPVYSGCLRSGGLLIMSGFYSEDLQVITQGALKSGLEPLNDRTENNWVAACFKKLK